MELFKDEIIEEYILWQESNPDNFTWWNYLNIKSDIKIALGFAKLFYPEIIELNNYIYIKDCFTIERYNQWKKAYNDMECIQKGMNSYEIKDFFHMNTDHEDKYIDEQITALGNVLKKFWTLSFKERFPNRNIVVELIEDDASLFITVFETEKKEDN